MKIQYLGTAAAEGCPALFCQCETCKTARATGGKNVRTRSQAMIDGKLDIDFPADAYLHELKWGLDYSRVQHYIFTHEHRDHFYPDEFEDMDAPYGVVPEGHPGYDVYGSEDIVKASAAIDGMPGNLRLHTMKPYRTYQVGDYQVTPVKASHGTPHPFNYIISNGTKTLFYMHDSGKPFEETWQYFEEHHIVFDLVSMDCTHGNVESLGYSSHMCFGYDKWLRDELLRTGHATEKTVFVANHFSHNGENVLYDDHAIYEAAGFVMSYDGLEIEF